MDNYYIYYERDGQKHYISKIEVFMGMPMMDYVLEDEKEQAWCFPEEIAKEKIATWQPYYKEELKLEQKP